MLSVPLAIRRSCVTSLLVVALAASALAPRAAEAQPRFRFPIDDPYGDLLVKDPVHVDHDPKTGTLACKDYKGRGLPHCYDGHTGTDLLLIDSFNTMDAINVRVVAAARGTVTKAVDGNYDRCRVGANLKPDCRGRPVIANRVEVTHDGGYRTRYLHLKKGSVKVKVGQKVTCGELLGYVGSSGYSVVPHLHFEVRSPDNKTIDPYAGPLSQEQTYWVEKDGPLGRPSRRCADDPSGSVDAYIYRDSGADDAGVDGADAGGADGGGADSAGDGAPACSSGCSAAGAPTRGGVVWWLLLLGALLALRRRCQSGSSLARSAE